MILLIILRISKMFRNIRKDEYIHFYTYISEEEKQ